MSAQPPDDEPTVLGKPVRLLDDPRLDAAADMKAAEALAAMERLYAVIGEVISLASLAEVLAYERARRRREADKGES